jgi:hypothetical protein
MGTCSLPPPVNYVASSPIHMISSVVHESIVPVKMYYFGDNSVPVRSVPFQLSYFGNDLGFMPDPSTSEL